MILLLLIANYWSIFVSLSSDIVQMQRSTFMHSALTSFVDPSTPLSSVKGQYFAPRSANSNRSSMSRLLETKRTLALLYPPGLMGGYRNQVLRFIALLDYGRRHDMDQLLLPSLLWTTSINGETWPIPFDWLFDVDYWNSFSNLPRLIQHVNGGDEQLSCWMNGPALLEYYDRNYAPSTTSNLGAPRDDDVSSTNSSSLKLSSPSMLLDKKSNNSLSRALIAGGTFTPLANITLPLFLTPQSTFTLRKTDRLPDVANCTRPFVYGGGIKAGRLWNDYMRISKQHQQQHLSTNTGDSNIPTSNTTNRTLSWWDTGEVYRALRPAPAWRALAHTCVRPVALHARVEIEMMQHACGQDMERNLTTIVQMVRKAFGRRGSTLVAVSRQGMYTDHPDYQEISQHNLRFLNESIAQGLVYECGASVLDQYYENHPSVVDHGTLLESVVNFYAAVSSEIFVGVKGSSYSNDIWTTRYWMGKGDQNYRYTREGAILRVEGLPQPHSNCKRKKRVAT